VIIANFQVKHKRPDKLSDPHYDFTPDLLEEILATPDSQLEFHHYANLLGPYLPAGTYKESVYFLPGAFRYLLAHDNNQLDLITPIIGFISKNHKNLSGDGILEVARDCIRECLAYWTSEFQVIHYDQIACREKGWGIKYFDYVKYCEVIVMATAELVRFESETDLAEEFVRDLAFNTDNPLKAAWFLQYSRSQNDVYHPPLYEPITRLINDEELLLKAAVVIEQQVVPNEQSPTYWQDTFKTLGFA
jgi:hypothetical protein